MQGITEQPRQSGGGDQRQKRIADFGTHIPGARKELAARRIEAGLDIDPGFRRPLGESWPAPAWEKSAIEHAAEGRPAEDLALVRALRDQLRTTRGRRQEQRLARGRTNGMRKLAMDLLEGDLDASDIYRELKAVCPFTARQCAHATILYVEVGHGHDLLRYEVIESDPQTGWIIYRGGGHKRVTGDTLKQAARNLRAKLETTKTKTDDRGRSSRAAFEIRYRQVDETREYSIWRPANGRRVLVRNCESVEEARRAIREDLEALETWWEQWRTIPESRRANNTPRSPAGSDGTENPSAFTARYRFRGVQFGNWVEDQRRRTDLRDTSQGLSDLAQALGWPTHALSLGGDLALAFGARGKGGARRVRAHYEPTGRVIAISKPLGPGTLAHEWFHALDHRVGHASENRGTAAYATENGGGGPTPISALSLAMRDFGIGLERSDLRRRSRKLDQRRSRANAYWSTTIEMAARTFEAWTMAKLQTLGITNDYLVNYISAASWEGNPQLDQGYPYPLENELEKLGPLIEKVAAAGARMADAWEQAPRPASRD